MDQIPDRIVSLLPAATEILYFLELEDRLVGVSSDCDWPESVRNLPSVSGTRIDDSKPSGSIDRQVREATHSGKSLYHVKPEQLKDLNPNLVITQEQCEVCAPSFDDVRDSCRRLAGDPEVVSLEAETLGQVLETILLIGEATHTKEIAEELIRNLKRREEKILNLLSGSVSARRVACIEWYEPLFRSGHWVPELVTMAGGIPFGKAGSHSAEIELDELAKFDPDLLLLMPCGFDLDRTVREGRCFVQKLFEHTHLSETTCEVYATDGGYFFSRPGPRLWDGFAILATVLHRDLEDEIETPEDSLERLV